MSQEEARALAERLRNDEEFTNRLAEASTQKERLQMARDAGYDLEVTDGNAIRAALGAPELSDEDLEKLVGGAGAGVGGAALIIASMFD